MQSKGPADLCEQSTIGVGAPWNANVLSMAGDF